MFSSYSGNMDFSSILKHIALALLSMSVTLHAQEKYQIKIKNSYTDHPKTIKILFLTEKGKLIRASRPTIAVGEETEITTPSYELITAAATVKKQDQEIPLGRFFALHNLTATYFHSFKTPDYVLMEYALKTNGIEVNASGYTFNMCNFERKQITVVNDYPDHHKVIEIKFLGRNREQIGKPTTASHGGQASVIIPPEHEHSAIFAVVTEKKDHRPAIPLGQFCAYNPPEAPLNLLPSMVTVEEVMVNQLEYKFYIKGDDNVEFDDGDERPISWGGLRH